MASQGKLLLVFTDSRGKNLDAYVDHRDILVKAYKGATLVQIISNAEHVIYRLHPSCVLIIGGTRDLTVLDSSTRRIALHYDTFDELLTHMLEVFCVAREETNLKFPLIKIAFGGLCGVDLNCYNGLPLFSNLQHVIDDTIYLLNYSIKTDNIAHGLIHPTLTSLVHNVRSPMHKRCNQYRLLSDGIHLSETLYMDWPRNIRRFYQNNLH